MEERGCQGGGMRGQQRPCQGADGTRRGGGRGGLLEPALLAALGRSEAHGYDLIRTIEAMTGGGVVPDAGGLYRMLRRFEAEGLVTSAWEGGEVGPPRREYRLTDDGRELLEHWLVHLEERRAAIDLLIRAVRETT